MTDTSVLMETIAAAMLDGITLSFTPIDADGTHMPTGFVVGVRHDSGARAYGNMRQVGFAELVMSGAAHKVLTEAIVDTMEPVVEAVLSDRESSIV